MGAAIRISKWLSGIKRKMSGKANIGKKLSTPYSLLIVAGQEKFNEMIQLLKYAEKTFLICGRIMINENETIPATGKISDIKEIIKKEKIESVLFCQGELNYQEIIEQFQSLNKSASFLIHSANCEAIIGSSNKDKKGIIICKE